MNRVIKFRGKRVDNGEWVYGYYFTNGTQHGIIHGKKFPGQWVEINPATIGQFTGLTDKDGKDIYEGDVCLIPDYRNGICITRDQPVKKQTMIYQNGFHGATFRGVSIIGNIHDNHELINEGGDQ